MSILQVFKYLPRNVTASIVNAGFGSAQPRPGVESAPAALLRASLEDQIVESGRTLISSMRDVDYSSLKPLTDPTHRGMNNPRWVSAATQSISDQVYQAAKTPSQVLTLGGDHSIAIGTLTGTARAVRERFGPEQKLGVIYVDAHADLNVPEDSASGNIHGMAVAFASGRAVSAEPGIFDWIVKESLVCLDRFVYIGLRDVDQAEKRTMSDQNIRTFWMSDVKQLGIQEVIRDSLHHLGHVPIHVSFDIDALDPTIAPCTGLPVPDGLSLSDATCIMNAIRRSGRLVAMDMVEVNLSLGDDEAAEKTLHSALAIIQAGLADEATAVV